MRHYSLFLFICAVAKLPKDIVPMVPISVIPIYVNILQISSTQHYTRIAQHRFPEQKILENDRMETASTEVTSMQRRSDIEKFTWRTHQYFVDFESRINVETSTSNRCHNSHVDSILKVDVVSTNFSRGNSTPNR